MSTEPTRRGGLEAGPSTTLAGMAHRTLEPLARLVRVTLAWTFILAGFAIIFGGVHSGLGLLKAHGFPVANALAIASFGVGLHTVRIGLRLSSPSGDQLLARDERDPVVYLRSFKDDSTTTGLELPVLGVASLLLPRSTFEEQLGPILSTIGPFIAIGRPGERLPQLGAARLYVDDARWQAVVSELMTNARAVVLLARRPTEGVVWEVREVVSRVDPSRVLVAVGTRGPGEWKAYRAAVGQFLPLLPEDVSDQAIVLFSSGWTPRVIERRNNEPGGFRRTVARALRQLDPTWVEPSPWEATTPERRFMAVLLLVGLAAAAVHALAF